MKATGFLLTLSLVFFCLLASGGCGDSLSGSKVNDDCSICSEQDDDDDSLEDDDDDDDDDDDSGLCS